MGLIESIFIVTFLILLNSIIVAAEIALVSVRRSRIEMLIRKGNRDAVLVKQALDNIQNYIIITQLGNTVVSLSLGWWGERIFVGFFDGILPHGSLTVIFGLSILTLIQLLIGELVPKGLVIRRPETYSLLLIRPLAFFLKLTYPLIFIINRTVNYIIKVIGMKNRSQSSHYSYEEIRTILQENVKKRRISINEFALIDNVMRLKKVRLRHALIDKNKIVGFPADMTFVEARKAITKSKHNFNRYPVYEKNKNKIIGFIHVHEIFNREDGFDDRLSLHRSGKIKPVIYCKETTKPDELLLQMHKNHIYVAVVMNRLDRMIGMITLADLLNHWLLRIG